MTPAQKTTLANELNNDPRGYGFLAIKGNDTATVEMLMRLRDGAAGNVPTNPTAVGGLASGIITIRRNDISGAEILQAVDVVGDGSSTATPQELEFFDDCAGMRNFSFVNSDGSDNFILKALKQCFNAGSVSRTNLGAISKRVGSRLEELFVAGFTVTEADVAAAYGRG